MVARINAIKPQSQATHVHLTVGEVLNTGTVVHVEEYLVVESGLKFICPKLEKFKLLGAECVEIITVCTHEMAEYRTWNDGILTFQTPDKLVHIPCADQSQDDAYRYRV